MRNAITSSVVPATASHPTDLLLVLVWLQRLRAQVTPPLKQHRVADKLEPRRELQPRLLEHLLQLLGGDVFCVAHFVRVLVKIDIGLDEKDVVD